MKRKTRTFLIIFTLFITLSLLSVYSVVKRSKADVLSTSLLLTYDTTVTPNVVDLNKKQAISIKPNNKGASFDFSNVFIKKSAIEFSISNNDFVGNIIFRYTSLNDTFDCILSFSDNKINASVLKNGEQAGISGSIGNSSVYNLNSSYTIIDYNPNITLSFDSTTKEISISSEKEKKLIWNFSNEENDGKEFYKLNDFVEYNIKVIFDSYSQDETEFLLYKLNDANIGSGLIERNRKPSLSAQQDYDALKDSEYKLAKPLAYDLIDGYINDIDVLVKDDKDKILLNTKYVDDLSFLSNDSKYYKVKYTVKNSYGNNETFDYQIVNYQNYSETNSRIILDKEIKETEYGLNSRIIIPKASFKSKLIISSISLDVYLSILKNDEIIDGFNHIKADKEYQLDLKEEGEYKIKYLVDDGLFDNLNEYSFNVIRDKNALVTSELNDYYYLNDTLLIPDATIYFNDDFIKADTKIIFPNGACYLNKQIVLNEKGLYEIEYSGTINNNIYTITKTFMVIDSIDSLFEKGENTTVEFGHSTVTSKVKGIHVKTTNNETLKYNTIVDLRKFSRYDLFLEMMADVTVVGQYDYTDINVILTDIYDEENFVKINAMFSKGNSDNNGTYIKTGASNGQNLIGWYGGDVDNKNIQAIWGYDTRHSFVGRSNHGEISQNTLKFYFDNENLRLYSGPCWGAGYDQIQDGLVADYDSNEFYGLIWKGFTTGEVYISIEIEGAVRREVGYTITSIGGLDFNSLNTEPSELPSLEIDFKGENSIPFGLVNQEYNLFNAKAVDKRTNETLEYTRTVYYKYGTMNEAEIPSTGTFIPKLSGVYTVLYRTTNRYSKTKIELYNINVFNEYDDIDFSLSPLASECYVGSVVSLPTVFDVINTSGNYKIEYQVKHNSVLVETSNNSFIPLLEGTYTISVTLTDYLGRTKTKEININSSVSNNPILLDDISLPRYFLTEHKYNLPLVFATDYSINISGTKISPKIYVTDMNNYEELLVDNIYEPTNFQDLESYLTTIKYVFETENGGSEYSFDIKTIKSKTKNDYYLINYFDTENATKELNDFYITFNLDTSLKSKIHFINSLSASTFSLDFVISEEKVRDFNDLKIKLTDSLNPNIYLVFTIDLSNEHGLISLNNGPSTIYSYSLYGSDMRQYSLKINNKKINDILMKTLFDPTTDGLGNIFSGFPSKKVYLDIETLSTNNDQLSILSINNQSFSRNIKIDKTEPELVLNSFGGFAKIGEKIVLSGGDAFDVLSDISYFYLTVRHGSSYVEAIDGTVLNKVDAKKVYEFIASEYGNYIVSYSAKDTCTAKGNSEIIINKTVLVIDEVAPVIKVSGNYKSSYKLNTVIDINPYVVTDNLTENPTSYVCVINPNGIMEVLNSTYELKQIGLYRIRYFAYDEKGNNSYIDYAFNVVE